MSAPDFTVENHGSIFILTPVTAQARDWADECLPGDAMTFGPRGIVVEHRYIGAIVEGLVGDGYTVA